MGYGSLTTVEEYESIEKPPCKYRKESGFYNKWCFCGAIDSDCIFLCDVVLLAEICPEGWI